MGLSELLHVLERDADAEVRAELARGEAEAARIDDEAARAHAARLAQLDQAVAAEARTGNDADVAAATRRARVAVLGAQAAMLDRLREAIRTRLPAVLAADAARLGPRLVAAALACAGEAPGKLRCAPVLEAVARGMAPPAIAVELDPGIVTGVTVELAAGTWIEASLDALLAREWPRLAAEAVARVRRREPAAAGEEPPR